MQAHNTYMYTVVHVHVYNIVAGVFANSSMVFSELYIVHLPIIRMRLSHSWKQSRISYIRAAYTFNTELLLTT